MSKSRFKEQIRLQQSWTAEEPQPKRLKLIFRERTVARILDDLEQTTDITLSLDLIKELGQFHVLKNEDVTLILRRCLYNFDNYSSDVRLRLSELLRHIVDQKWLAIEEAENIATLILETFNIAGDDCLSILMSIMLKLLCGTNNDHGFHDHLEKHLIRLLTSLHWKVRKYALLIKTQLFLMNNLRSPIARLKNDDTATIYAADKMRDVENLLLKFCTDCDERVRISASEALMTLLVKAGDLGCGVYPELCSLLNDPCSTVRVYALQLIHRISSLYPEMLVPGPNKNTDIRLVDDAFSKLCDAMHDISVDVRTVTAKLLGKMSNVSEKFLQQTLDKKLMNQLKYLKNMDQRSSSLLSEWSTGRKFGEDAAMEKIDEDLQALIPSGACGAFVSGLEDEYMAVRSASIDAVSQLSQQSNSFANKALDFLADMFNDEIDEVRLNAINALRRLCQHIVLREDQLETILTALDDASSDSREALRELLSSCTLYTVSCLKLTIDSLINNLKRYPQDKTLIWNCMKHLGYRHSSLVQPMVADLLGYHAFFDMPEPCIDDSFYISKLLLVLNAAANSPPIRSLLLPHTWRHYDYLRNSNPQLTPSLNGLDDESNVIAKSTDLISDLTIHTESTLKLALAANKKTKCEMLKLTLRNLERLCKFNHDNGAKVNFLQLFCSSLLTFYTALESLSELDSFSVYASDTFVQLIIDTFKMQMMWNMDDRTLRHIVALRCCVLSHLARMDSKYADLLNSTSNDLKLLLGSSSSTSEFDSPEPGACKKRMEEHALLILNAVPSFSDTFTQKTVFVTEPDKQTERVLRFSADLVAAIPFACTFTNFNDEDFDCLRIRVTYPDQRSVLQRLRRDHVKQATDGAGTCFRLRTNAFVSDVVWSDVASVELSLVAALSSPYDTVLTGENLNSTPGAGGRFVQLTPALTLRIFPKAKC